jgi:uncharacterized phage protein (TIGR02218 family)
MKAVSWETSANALITFLDSTTQPFMADLYTITLSGGQVIRYSGLDVAVGPINGNTFALGPLVIRGGTKVAIGVAVDSLSITFAPAADSGSAVAINGVPLLQFIAGGGLDGARIVLERAFSSGPGAAWVGTVVLFAGSVGEPTTDRYQSVVPVNSDSQLLTVMVPATLYQPPCKNTLFDATCALLAASFAVGITATSATDASRRTFSSADAHAADYYSLGYLVGLTGANAGVQRTVKSFSGGSFTTVAPWPAAVAAADTFTAYPGCDHQQATCSTKFSNLIHFRGYPYVPAPETVM